MKICHLCLNGPYNEGWNYQENLLPKYHAKQGNDVYQIVTPYMWKGTELVLSEEKKYTNNNNVNIIRCKVKRGKIGGTRFNRYPELKQMLKEIRPEILFIHDVQFLDIVVVAEYLKEHSDCIAYADNHSDFSNSARNWISKNILHKIIWKNMAKIVAPYIKKFYGVLPARVDFLTNIYQLPKDKCELLVMGADDELVKTAKHSESREKIRKKYGISTDDFLVMTGGKIDAFKTQTILLMQAVRKSKNSKLKLIVFGSVAPELQEQVHGLADGEKVQYIGWIDSKDSYFLFAAADLVVFPGRHSVFWEQVAGQGIPMLVKYWEGTTHVDCGGNVEFLYEDSEEEILEKVEKIAIPERYFLMKKIAEKSSTNFMYSTIAKKSIEV